MASYSMPVKCGTAGVLRLAGRSLELLDHLASLGSPLVYGAKALLLAGQSLEPLGHATWPAGTPMIIFPMYK